MSGVKLSLQNVRSPDWYGKERKIGKHSRKLNGDVFVAPRIVLPPDFNHLIGKNYLLYEADVEVETYDWWRKKLIKGKAILIIVPESEEELEEYSNDFEGDYEFD